MSKKHHCIVRTPEPYLFGLVLNPLFLSNTFSKLTFKILPWLPGMLQVVFCDAVCIRNRAMSQTENNLGIQRNSQILTHLLWTVIYHGWNYDLLKNTIEPKTLYLNFRSNSWVAWKNWNILTTEITQYRNHLTMEIT